MKLVELMDPKFKSYFKRDPFDILLLLLNGLHEDFNKAKFRN